MPAEITVQVFRGDPVEAPHPAFEAAVIAVHVLDVIDASDAFACAQIERDVRQPRLAREDAIGCGAVADQNRPAPAPSKAILPSGLAKPRLCSPCIPELKRRLIISHTRLRKLPIIMGFKNPMG
jgi:hypothetical protein